MMELPRVVVMVTVMVIVATGRGEELQDSLKQQHLRDTLLEGYNKEGLPPTPAMVNVSQFSIRDLEMHEGAHRLSLHAWIGFTWKDKRLSWKAEDYGGLKKLSFSPRHVWLPDLSVYNAGDAEATLLTSRFRVIVQSNGEVLHVPSLDLHYSCVADLTYWPHDTHNCTLKIGSWVHDGNTIDIRVNEGTKVEMEVTESPQGHMDTMEWEIVDSRLTREEKLYDCCIETYVNMKALLVVRRDAPAYAWIIKTPAVCLILLTTVLFILPPRAGEKIIFGGLCIILNLMFLVFAHGTVRNAPSHTPLLVQLVTLQLVLAVTSVLIVAVVIRASRAPYTSPPGPSLHRLALTLAPALGLSAYMKQFPQTEEEWKSVAGQFEQDWQFPHCLGALDGKHVDIIPPADSGSLFYNYKGRHSLVLMAIANAKCEFIMCDFGSNGRNSDGGVIQNTLFYRKLTNKSLNIPAEGQLDKSHRVLPYVFVCDDAFALRPDMMKPYRMGDLTGHNERKIFNYRLSRARRVIESAFGIMASRFRIFHTRINLSLDNIDAVVMACCVLHNYLVKSSLSYASADCFDVENINCGTTVQGLRAEDSNMMNIARRNQGNPMEAAKIIRENFADYFISEGKLPWQDNFIE